MLGGGTRRGSRPFSHFTSSFTPLLPLPTCNPPTPWQVPAFLNFYLSSVLPTGIRNLLAVALHSSVVAQVRWGAVGEGQGERQVKV